MDQPTQRRRRDAFGGIDDFTSSNLDELSSLSNNHRNTIRHRGSTKTSVPHDVDNNGTSVASHFRSNGTGIPKTTNGKITDIDKKKNKKGNPSLVLIPSFMPQYRTSSLKMSSSSNEESNNGTYGSSCLEDVFAFTSTPGMNGYLEIEESIVSVNSQSEDVLGLGEESISTSSGLLLQHRKSPQLRSNDCGISHCSSSAYGSSLLYDAREQDENNCKQFGFFSFFRQVIQPNERSPVTYNILKNAMFESYNRQPRSRLIVWFKLIFCGSFVFLVAIAGVKCIKIQRSRRESQFEAIPKIELPMMKSSNESPSLDEDIIPKERKLRRLQNEFEEWTKFHIRDYKTEEEKQKRFDIWMSNHQRTIEKNKRHGPCKQTGKQVFGSNHFKDLTPEEFQGRFLTGYRPPADHIEKEKDKLTSDKLHALLNGFNLGGKQKATKMNKKYIQHYDSTSSYKKLNEMLKNETLDSYTNLDLSNRKLQNRKLDQGFQPKVYSDSSSKNINPFETCGFTNWSCWLQWLFDMNPYGSWNMEPTYDSSNFPDSLDWRDKGAVTSIHSQGQCGACWAIAAVETVESAYFLKTGDLLDLSEQEVVLCDDTCEMCYGGWPQNAYDFVMNNNGLLLEQYLSFDDSLLLAITMCKAGQADYFSEEDIDGYINQICPSGSQDSSVTRYGNIRGYGYTTERCICYTNGEGCDCEEQDEQTAIANVASYGPAVVCLDASTWQDYEGGIMTAESGCSQEFLSMNHCVQVVGFVFTDGGDDEGDNGNSHSGSQDGGREGYWIVRNQWSTYWGMNGYAYVGLGGENQNTCGILNDMTQTFM